MSPGKCSSPTMNPRRSPSPAATRFLTFGPPKMGSFSWADRVRGFSSTNVERDTKITRDKTPNRVESSTVTNVPSPVLEATIEESINMSASNSKTNLLKEKYDNEGWEIVTKGRSRSKGSNLSNSSGSSVQKKPGAINPISKKPSEDELEKESGGSIKAENLSRSSTIIEEYVDCSKDVFGDFSDTMYQSSCSFNMDSVDLAFGLTESEIQIKEEHEKVNIFVTFKLDYWH